MGDPMPVPSSIDELSITPAENSPPGSEAVFPMLDDYLRTLAAFIAQTKLMAENAKKRENHTGTQAIETVAGLEEALAKRVAKSSDTGVMYVPEGTDAQRPLAADIPAGVAAVRGNSTSPTDRFLEFWNRVTNTWDAIASRKWVTDLIEKLFSPSVTGNAVMTGVDNKIVLSDIVSKLSLEKGDVVRVVAGAYNKLHTAESLLNSNEIVVNYEHCGSRGNGPLKLQDFTGPVTITRIAKWYNAPLGLGQDWVNTKPFRTSGVTSLNSTGRAIQFHVSGPSGSTSAIQIELNGVLVYTPGTGTNSANSVDLVVARSSSWSVTGVTSYNLEMR